MHPHLSFVTLAVEDLGRARAFYEALGLVAGSASNDRVAFFQLNGVILGLYGRGALAEDAGVDPDTEFRTVIAHNCPERSQVDAVMAQAAAVGARITQPAAEVFWGGYRGYFQDPDGHLWEVAHNPFIRWDEQAGVWMD